MPIKHSVVNGVAILALSGKIGLGNGELELRRTVSDVLNAGAHKVLLNLANVTSIDSSGVGELVSAYTTLSGRGGKLSLCNVPPTVRDVLEITQLITVFEVFDTEEAALASL